MKKIGIVLCLAVSLGSCSLENRAERSLRRALRLNPDLKLKDTVLVSDTVLITEKEFKSGGFIIKDTTVTVINNKYVTLKYYYDSKKDSLNHDLVVKADTIIKEIKVPFEKIVQVKDSQGTYYFIGLILLLLFIIGLLVWK